MLGALDLDVGNGILQSRTVIPPYDRLLENAITKIKSSKYHIRTVVILACTRW